MNCLFELNKEEENFIVYVHLCVVHVFKLIIFMKMMMALIDLLSMQKYIDSQNSEDRIFKVGIFVHKNCDHSYIGQKTAGSTYNVLFR